MKPNYKHIILVFMVLTSSAPFLLPGSFMVQRAFLIHEMKEKLENSALQVVQADAASVKWYKKGKECWIDNRLFDVKELRKDGDKLVLTGLFDDKEKNIIASMESVSAPLPKEKERSNAIFQFTHLDIETTSIPEYQAIILLSGELTAPHLHLPDSFVLSVFLPPELI
jgi:hypothetical protein